MTDDEILNWLSRDRSPIRRDGALPENEVAEALTSYFRNGRALIDDARFMVANGRWSRAASIAVLSLEELAKVPMLANAYLQHEYGGVTDAWKDFWKALGKHRDKQKHILCYGSLLKERIEADGPFNRWLYRFSAPEGLFERLDAFKQSGFYVDLRMDGVHAPNSEIEVRDITDLLLALAQERCDSFESWHVTSRRSLDFLKQSFDMGETGLWPKSFQPEEVEADIIYSASAMSAGIVPDYHSFTGYVHEYRKRVADKRLKEAFLSVAKRYRERMDDSRSRLPQYHGRLFEPAKLLISIDKIDKTFGKSFGDKITAILFKDDKEGPEN
ncbi:AbiV family abortive infection protein [Tsuneonella sp. HG094]